MIESTSPRPFVFVLMPFSGKFDDVYMLGIKTACQEAGTYCERVDEQIFTGSILERIYNQISKADIIVSDMSSRNPNVFYETGYAHALGKQVILLTQEADDIPFDMRHYPHIIYNNISGLKVELRKRIEWSINNPKDALPRTDYALEFFIQGQKLESNTVVSLPASPLGNQNSPIVIFDFPLDLHNASKTMFNLSRYQITLVGDWETRNSVIDLEIDTQTQHRIESDGFYEYKELAPPSYTDKNIIVLPSDVAMYIFPEEDYRILPDGWHALKARLAANIKNDVSNVGKTMCTLRVFSELGVIREISFYLELSLGF